MKRNLCLLLLASALLFVACKKEPANDHPDPIVPSASVEDYPQLVLGQWDAVLDQCYESYTEPNYEEITYANEWSSSLSLTFKDNGKVTYCANLFGTEDSWDDSYALHADTLLWDVKPYKIKRLDQNNLVIEWTISEDRTTSGGTTYTTTATKHYELVR